MANDKLSMITLTLPNGEVLEAPVGIWLTAMLSAMGGSKDPAVVQLSQDVVNTVGNMIKQSKGVSPIARPGHHVMKAEGINLGAMLGSSKLKH